MAKRKIWYRYQALNHLGQSILHTSDWNYAVGEANAQNLELREKLPDLRIGKSVHKNRYRVLRRITNQLSLKV